MKGGLLFCKHSLNAITLLMQHVYLRFCLLILVGLIGLNTSLFAQATSAPMSQPQITGFVKNVGQWPSMVLYCARLLNTNVWITTNGAVVDEYTIAGDVRTGYVYNETLLSGSLSNAQEQRVEAPQQITFINERGRFSAPVVSSVTFRDAVPGVDVVFEVRGSVDVVRTVRAQNPDALKALRMQIQGRRGDGLSEVTPPTSLVYGAYIGGAQADVMAGIEVLSGGDVVIAGSTTELSFPTTLGGYSKSVKGSIDAFVLRCDAKLQRVSSYTFYGGSADERVRALTVDANNNVYICGETISTDLPTTNTATNRTYKAGIDAFVAKFDSTLTKLTTGFYHGGNRDDIARGIAVDDNGIIVVAGSTTSTVNLPNTMPATAALTWTFYPMMGNPEPINVPITSGRTNSGQTDGFVATFTGAGIMQQSRYYGKEGVDYFTAVAFDKSGNVYLTGSTTSTNFETVPVANAKWSGRLPYDRTYNGGTTDAFVVRFNSNLTYSQTDGETFSTFLGGNRDEEARTIQVDALGRIYITGVTTSTNMPAVGTYATNNMGKRDAFYAQFGADGGDISGCTYFGGAGDDELVGARLIPNTSSLVLYGSTESSDFPIEGQGARSERVGATEGFMSVLSLGALNYSSLIVGNQADTVVGAVAERLGDLFFTANTTSSDLRTHDSSFARAPQGHSGYVGKLAYGILELSSPTGGETVCVGGSRSISWSALGMADTTKFRIEYSIAGSGAWKDVIRSVGGRSYSWKVPSLPNGQYVIRVSTIHGHVSELVSPFTISNPPTITTQPKNVSACLGQPVTLSVVAAGSGLKYQWRKAGVNIPTATEAQYTIPDLDAASLAKYDCVVSGTCTPNVTSQSCTVSSATSTEITKQPQPNVLVNEGASFTLSVSATGSDLAYQWLKNNVAIAGATVATYTVNAAVKADEGQYTCEVTGGCGKVVSSASTVVVQGGTSVDDQFNDGTYVSVLGPQPAGDVVRVYVSVPEARNVSARIIDMRSNVIGTFQLGVLSAGAHTHAIPVGEFAAGCYVLEIRVGDVYLREMIAVQR